MSPKSRLTSEYALQTSCHRDARPEGLGLLVQVGILAAGHLVARRHRPTVTAGPTRRGHTAADLLPVAAHLDQGRGSTPGLARREPERLDDRVEARLRGQSRHRRDGTIGDVEADVGALQDAGGLGPADVVGVEVDRHADLLAQRLDQRSAADGLHRPAMSLIAIRLAPAFSSSLASPT